MTKWPNREEIQKVLNRLDENPELYSRAILNIPSHSDRIKRDICAEFIVYKREHGLNTLELAQKINISEAQISSLLSYRFDEFTLDRLIHYLEVLEIIFELKKNVQVSVQFHRFNL